MMTFLQDSYILFYNIWWGEAVSITFDTSLMKLNATSKSGDFSSKNEIYFTLELISLVQKKILSSITASGIHTTPFVKLINNLSFNYGDILSIRTTGILKEPFISNGDNLNLANCHNSWGKSLAILLGEDGVTSSSNCANIPEYFLITPKGLVQYTPTISIDPLNILGRCSVTQTTLSGISYANSPILVSVDNNIFTTSTDGNGYFSLLISTVMGFSSLTKIIINVLGFELIVYPQLLPDKNLPQQTVSGFKYLLNADAKILTTPFDNALYYGRSILSSHGKKAWDLSYSILLKYNNSNDEYPRDSSGNTIVYVDYSKFNILITSDEAEMIQKYLVRNCPRMFHLKDWAATPVYNETTIVGQNFYIGNGAQEGNSYLTQLLQTEASVTYILSKIQKNMSIYQIIQIIQLYYERMLSYEEIGDFEDIRGSFIAHKCVCGGYSKGFEYLLQRVGIENIWVQGFAGGGPHAWNFVNIYKKWFLSDTTWGGQNWYLDGSDSRFTEGHHVSNIYSPMPILFNTSIPYNIGNINQDVVNLLGTVSFRKFSSSISIFYKDENTKNTSMTLNYFHNRWTSIPMVKSA